MASKSDSMMEEQVIETEDLKKTDGKPVGPSSTQDEASILDEMAGPTAEPIPEVTVEEELEKVKRDLAALEDRFLRQAADFQNFRKRAFEERAYSVEIGKSQVALPVVDVLDDLRRSLEASDSVDSSDQTEEAEANSVVALGEGVRLVYEKLESELAKLRVTPMDVVGQPFDENRHDAMMQQPAPDGTDPGTVLAEIQKGYMIGDKVLRHARVVVSA